MATRFRLPLSRAGLDYQQGPNTFLSAHWEQPLNWQRLRAEPPSTSLQTSLQQPFSCKPTIFWCGQVTSGTRFPARLRQALSQAMVTLILVPEKIRLLLFTDHLLQRQQTLRATRLPTPLFVKVSLPAHIGYSPSLDSQTHFQPKYLTGIRLAIRHRIYHNGE